MKALSIKQPWAWLTVRPDLTGIERAKAIQSGVIKDIENRTWKTKRRGPTLIHASAGMTFNEYARVQSFLTYRGPRDFRIELPPFRELQRGGIVGIADIVDCVDTSNSPWYMGHIGFVLVDARPLPFVPFKGALQFFSVPDELIELREAA